MVTTDRLRPSALRLRVSGLSCCFEVICWDGCFPTSSSGLWTYNYGDGLCG